MNIFKIDKKVGWVDFDNEFFSILPEFKVLQKRRIFTKGDHDGREKVGNKQLFTFIYYVAEWTDRNPYSRLPMETRMGKAKEAAGFPSTYEPDKDVVNAIVAYVELQQKYMPTVNIILSIEQNLYQSAEYFKTIQEQNRELISTKSSLSRELTTATTITNKTEVLLAIKAVDDLIQGNMKSVTTYTASLKKALQEIEGLREQARVEIIEARRVTGNRELYNREVPNE